MPSRPQPRLRGLCAADERRADTIARATHGSSGSLRCPVPYPRRRARTAPCADCAATASSRLGRDLGNGSGDEQCTLHEAELVVDGGARTFESTGVDWGQNMAEAGRSFQLGTSFSTDGGMTTLPSR